MTQDENNDKILDQCFDEMGEEYFPVFELSQHHETVLKAMAISNKQTAFEFFKWYGVKMVGFIQYIKDIRPRVISEEFEEKIKEFEGQTFDSLYALFLKETQNEVADNNVR